MRRNTSLILDSEFETGQMSETYETTTCTRDADTLSEIPSETLMTLQFFEFC